MRKKPARVAHRMTAWMVGIASLVAATLAVTQVAKSEEQASAVADDLVRAADSVAASRAATVQIEVDRRSFSVAQTSRLGGRLTFHLLRSTSSEGECLDVFALRASNGDDAGHVGGCGARRTDTVTEGWHIGGLLIDDRTVYVAFGYAEPSATTVTLTRVDGSSISVPVTNGTWLLVEPAVTEPSDGTTQTEMPYVSIASTSRSGEVLGATSLE